MQTFEPANADVGSVTSGSAVAARRLTLLLIFFAAICLRFAHLTAKPFWFDECYSVALARIGGRDFVHLLWWREANMSLYYSLLRIWMHFGQREYFIRSLSALISAGSVLATYWLGRLLFHARAGLVSAALLAINVYDIRYAQEVRSYSLFVFLATLSSAFFAAYLRRPEARYRRAYSLVIVLAVYSHFYAVLLIVAHWLTLRYWESPQSQTDRRGDDISLQFRRAWVKILAGVSPLLIFIVKTGAGPIKWIHRPGFHELALFFTDITNGFPILYFAAALTTFLPLYGTLQARTRAWETWRVGFLLVCSLFPIVLTILLSFARPLFLPRYMILCIPPLLILVAAGLTAMRSWWLSGILVFGTLLLSARITPLVYTHDFDSERDASGIATNFILDHSAPGDGIILHIAGTRTPYEFFRSLRAGTNTASAAFAGQLGPEIIFPHHGPGLDYRDFTGKPTEDFVRQAAQSHARVWLMLMDNGSPGQPDPTTVMMERVLPEMLPQSRVWEFPRVEVRLYGKD